MERELMSNATQRSWIGRLLCTAFQLRSLAALLLSVLDVLTPSMNCFPREALTTFILIFGRLFYEVCDDLQ
jgi:hypothetical protein